ncbi:hypothetical protein EOL96_02760 [Candidatus Saccharibacteria bacterium]|nr:hypothetical protein [Candidatus Saccharibacteria bacterium]
MRYSRVKKQSSVLHKAVLYFFIAIMAITPFTSGWGYFNGTAYAESSDCDYNFYAGNDIIIYDPCALEVACSIGSAVGSYTDSAENAEAIFKYLISTNFSTNNNNPLTPLQAAAFLGNFSVESGYDPGIIQSGKLYDEAKALDPSIGGYAFGLVQWDSGRRVALIEYAKSKSKVWSDLSLQLDFIKFELEGTEKRIMQDFEFRTTTSVDAATLRVRKVYERPGIPHDDKRIAAANDAYLKYKDLAPGGLTISADGCTVSGGNGDVAVTAATLAWPKSVAEGATDHTILQNKPEYAAALEATGVNKLGDRCSMGGNSCDAFVATVMRFSGVDKDFPCCGANYQNTYLRNNPDKYELITTEITATNDPKLQPGDILWADGHIKIFLGGGRQAQASHCVQTGEQSKLYLDKNYRAYRAK